MPRKVSVKNEKTPLKKKQNYNITTTQQNYNASNHNNPSTTFSCIY